jgi:hypothetical protein
MSTISNRFFVTTLDDGTTLHGNLSAEGGLTQAWNGTAADPQWTVSYGPTIYLTLLNGSDYAEPDAGFTWLYNGAAIQFASGSDVSTDGLFKKTTKSIGGKTMPALKIIDNLASSANRDMDMITFNGTHTTGEGAGIGFSCSIQIRITELQPGGYLGVINFENGVADITSQDQTVTMYADLIGGDNLARVSGYTCNWYLNGRLYDATDTAHFSANTHPVQGGVTINNVNYPAFVLHQVDVVDHATIRCEFVVGGVVKYTAYVGVDDMQDPEYMYIQYDGGNGNAASLRQGQSVTFTIWVGTRDNPAPSGGFNWIDIQLLDGDSNVITDNLDNIPNVVPNTGGLRKLSVAESGDNAGKATLTVSHAVGKVKGKKHLTGIIYAYTADPRPQP